MEEGHLPRQSVRGKEWTIGWLVAICVRTYYVFSGGFYRRFLWFLEFCTVMMWRGWWRVNKSPILSIFMDFLLFISWVSLRSSRTGIFCSSVFTFPIISLCFHFFCPLCLLFCFLTVCCFIYFKSSLGRELTGSSYLLALTTRPDPNARPRTCSLWFSLNNGLCFHFR